MAKITVESIGDTRYRVSVAEEHSQTTHVVTVDPGGPHHGASGAEELVAASFRFLLDREPKESILSEFDIDVISSYFPEFPTQIVNYLD